MNKNKMIRVAIIVAILSSIIYLGYSNIKLMSENYDKQKKLNEICSALLYDVVIGYDYDNMKKNEVIMYQNSDIYKLHTAGGMIQYTSWPLKEKIQDVVIQLYRYLNAIYQNSEIIEDSKAQIILDNYLRIFNYRDSNYCEKYIDKLSEFLEAELNHYY